MECLLYAKDPMGGFVFMFMFNLYTSCEVHIINVPSLQERNYISARSSNLSEVTLIDQKKQKGKGKRKTKPSPTNFQVPAFWLRQPHICMGVV